MSYEGLLNKTCTIESPVETQTGTGEISRSWSEVAAGVKTRIHRVTNSREQVLVGDYQVTLEDFKFHFMPSVTVEKNYRIVVGSDTYEVLAVVNDSSGRIKTVFARVKSFD